MSQRSMWRGAISFGMVSIPVRLYVANESKGISFRLLCPTDQTPVKTKRWCPKEDREVGWNDAVRGYEVSKDEYVVVEDSDLEGMPLATVNQVAVLGFVADSEINTGLYVEGAYYVEPEKIGAKPFALLHRALRDSGKVAIAKVALRNREHLCRIAVEGDGILLNTLHWPDEIRDASELTLPGDSVQLSGQEVELAHQLVENLSVTFNPGDYRDAYREAVLDMVGRKQRNEPAPETPTAPAEPQVDLMAALKASIAATKKPAPAA
jgi:DNA end-binding protein Ku